MPAASAVESQTALVREALAGDTVRLAGGKTLRYIGAQAPSLQSKILLAREYGAAALAYNKSLVEGKTVRIEWDSQIRDENRNLLGYVYLENGVLVNEALIKAGHAKARLVAPNLKKAALLRQAELTARRDNLGLWKAEPKNPYLNEAFIGDSSTKIFYLPTSTELERIPASNLRTFRSRVEARAAGYRACPSCRADSVAEDV